MNHVSEPFERENSVLHRMSDIMHHKNVFDTLKRFLRSVGGGSASLMRVQKFLSDSFRGVVFNDIALRNTIAKVRENDTDAHDFIQTLREMNRDGDVEFMSFKRTRIGVLKSVTWSFKGARRLVQRSKDISFWDSTHTSTLYDYKLSCMTVVDSECVSRTVLFHLTLHEDCNDLSRLLSLWKPAFGVPFPNVFMTDGDAAMGTAVSAMPSDQDTVHLRCVFHIFDKNVSDAVKTTVNARTSSTGWPLFRKGLSFCREASTEEEFKRLWNDLLNRWLPNDAMHREKREYMKEHV